MANLGFVGLGVMGGQMVSRLMDKGHTVTGYNRTKSKAQWLIDKGMQWGDSPRAVCEAADVTFSMVTNSSALEGISRRTERNGRGTQRGQVPDRHEHRQPRRELARWRHKCERRARTWWMRPFPAA